MTVSRNTKQRKAILHAVEHTDTHPTADEIYQIIQKAYPSISLGTVYRNLNVLACEGKIKRINMPGGGDRFDHTTKEHSHFYCHTCNDVLDIDFCDVEALLEQMSKNSSHKITKSSILLEGTCKECL